MSTLRPRTAGLMPMRSLEWAISAGRARRRPKPTLRALIVALVLPFVGSALSVMLRLSDAEHQTRETQNLGIVRAFSSEVDRQLLSAEAALQALATSPQLHDRDWAAFYRQSGAVAEQHGARIRLIEPDGRVLFSTMFPLGTALPEAIQPAKIQAAATSQRTQVSDLFFGSVWGEPLVGIWVPVIEDGSTRYVVGMAFRPERLSRFFAEQHVPDTWTIAITDRDGTLIGRNRALDRFLGKPVTPDLKAAMEAAPEGLAILHTEDGMEVYTAFTRSAFSGWTVAFGIPREIVEAPLRQSLVEIGIAGVVMILIGGSVALLTAHRISRSMTTLSAAALALGNGEPLLQINPAVREMGEVVGSLRIADATLASRSGERDRAETALRESEQRFRDIAEIGGDWIWETDTEHRFTHFTGDSLERMASSGISPAATLGKTRWQLAEGDPAADAIWRQHKADLDSHQPFRQFQYSLVAASGRCLYFSVNGKPVLNERGEFCGYRGTASEVTDTVNVLRRAECAEALLRDAVDSISEGFVIYDAADRFVMCNDAYRRLYPKSAERMVPGVPFVEILRASVTAGGYAIRLGEEKEWLARRMSGHNRLEGAIEHQLSDGRWVLVSERRMRNGGTAGLRIDITDLKLVQAALRESEERLNRAQRLAALGSDLCDLRTGEREWSDESYRIFGVTRENFAPTQENVLSVIHPDDRLATQARTAVGICPPPIEYRIIRADGCLRHLYREWELIPDDAGSPVQLFGTIHDVTEIRAAQVREKELERQLAHSQKLEALGTLAGGVAHDLNNTLVPILALSRLVAEDLPANSPVRGDVETVIQASERARDLVKQILAFSRKQDLVKQQMILAQVTREALRMLRASLPATIEIIERISEVPPLFGNAGELHQVVVNLLTNAAQAIGGEVGKIRVSVWSTSPSHAAPNDLAEEPVIRLSIADTGCGMDAATLDRVFDPFFTTKGVGDGTGLGLSVVHGIVAGHGGTIAARSTPGEGSEFTLSFPVLGQIEAPVRIEPAAA